MSTELGKRAGSPDRWRTISFWVLVSTIAALALARAVYQSEADVFWASMTGSLELTSGEFQDTDKFSFLHPEREWRQNATLFPLLLGASWELGGYAGIGVLNLVLVAALYALMSRDGLRAGAHPAALVAVVAVSAPLMIRFLIPRPHLASFLLLMILVALWEKLSLRAAGGARSLNPAAQAVVGSSSLVRWCALTGVLGVLWVNTHLAGVLMLALAPAAAAVRAAGVFREWESARIRVRLRAAESESGAQLRLWRELAGCGLVAAAGLSAFASREGWRVLEHASSTRAASTAWIVEWQPSLSDPGGLGLVVLGGIGVWLCVRRGLWVRAVLAAGLLVAALDALRFAPMAFLIVAPVLALALSQGAVAARASRSRGPLLSGALLLVGLVGMGAVSSLNNLGRPGAGELPSVETVRAIPDGCRVVGKGEGVVVLEGYERGVRVSWDGRNDLYGVGELRQNVRVWLDEDPLRSDRYLDHHGVGCVLLPESFALVERLVSAPGWEERARDREGGRAGRWVLVVRDQPKPAPGPEALLPSSAGPA